MHQREVERSVSGGWVAVRRRDGAFSSVVSFTTVFAVLGLIAHQLFFE